MDGSLRTSQIAPDSPIATAKRDLFGRARLAEAVADTLLRYRSPDSVILGIEGAWGSGKTSVLNLIAEYVESREEAAGQPKIIQFHPSWFTPSNALPIYFFEQLSVALDRKRDRVAKSISSAFSALARALASAPTGGIASAVLRILGQLVWEGFDGRDGIEHLKQDLANRLQDHKVVIWVFIDDLDRLLPSEVAQMLSLMRGVGDLPNVRYVLAYDRVALLHRVQALLGPRTTSSAP